MATMMRGSATRGLTGALTALVPALVTLACVFVARIPFGVPGLGSIMPLLPLAAVFFWSIRRPDMLTPLIVFGLGLVDDALAGTPFGLGALILMAVRWIAVGQRRVFLGKPFALMWWGFATVASVAAAGAWIVGGLARGTLPPAGPLAAQLALALVLFPVVAWVLGRVDRLIAEVR
jgi:rod shape-determining protein MreD